MAGALGKHCCGFAMSIKLSGPALTALNRESASFTDLMRSAEKLVLKDHTLWGAQAQEEARIRLDWVDLHESSRRLLPELDALSAWARSNGLTKMILAGMGGSSLAPEVLGKYFHKSITVLDSTDPQQILAALPSDFTETVIMVGSKSGSTIETASQRALFAKLISDAGLKVADHMVIVTDPGSPLDIDARTAGIRVINANPNVGGRYSALTAFGLVPAALMGIDVSVLLDDAAGVFKNLESAVSVASLLFELTDQAIAFYDEGSNVPGISDWIEQLVAESTGKEGKGRIPIVIESAHSPIGGKIFTVAFSGASADLIVEGTLGEQFIFWELVTALLSRAIGIDPFNQPNVTEAKERTSALLATWSDGLPPRVEPDFAQGDVQVFGAQSGSTLREIAENFLKQDNYYFAIMAYLNREADFKISQLRTEIARATDKPTTFGWGPRFLHSTGQFHKGGQLNGAFIQITSEEQVQLEIPGKTFGFGTLIRAQALGDGQALSSRELPVIRFHLADRSAGIAQLLEAFKS
jgi:glucose-6-phosphate isomerase